VQEDTQHIGARASLVILGLLVHMVVIGLPISFSVRRRAKNLLSCRYNQIPYRSRQFGITIVVSVFSLTRRCTLFKLSGFVRAPFIWKSSFRNRLEKS
jgi:hypothetical protein